MDLHLDTLIALASAGMTGYFWLLRSRRERPHLTIHQLSNFRTSVRRGRDSEGARLMVSQVSTGGVLIANHSTRQNSVLRFDCYARIDGREVRGDWGWTGEDQPPWNIGPETAVAVSPACFFAVPEGYSPPDDFTFRIELVTVSPGRFAKELSLEAPVG